ncbi:efflux RND transporter permease subunit [Thermocrispum agreste]|uniref:efflux RND transporter permease subunit n=1 Tax=Thermocrispum agreste TaxID=37925 RepID=UPI00041BF414|nr:efflux RND transporter permease subunit [Thermocrispum agreste]
MTGLTRLSLANRALVILISLVISAVGVFAIPQLKQQLFPSLSLPMVSVVTPYPGAPPETVEDQVTEPIENRLRSLDSVEELTSVSAENVSTVRVAFDYGNDPDELVNDIKAAVAEVENELPEGAEPQVVAGSTDDIPVLVLAVSNGDGQRKLADKLERIAVPELEAIPDVADVAITGAREDRVVIKPDADELAERGLTTAAIVQTLQANGVVVPAGSLTAGNRSITVQVGSKLTSIADIENLYLPPAAPATPGQGPGAQAPGAGGPNPAGQAPAGTLGSQNPAAQQAPGAGQQAPTGQQGPAGQARPQPVKLGDVASVRLEPEEATSLTRTNGKPSLGLSITMVTDGDAVGISHEVRDRIDDIAAQLGNDTEITVVFDQSPYVERSIEDLTTEGVLGLVFAVLVIMIFLLSLRSTLVTAVSIPLSVVIALIALWIGDYSLNMLTLGGLTISIGRVVDDSIVVLENIKRHLGYGEPKHRAVLNGVREVAGAVTSSTLTTVAVFLPIAFVSGLVGQLFSSFAITVTVALLASLLVSLTVIPVLAYWFLRRPKQAGAEDDEEARERVRSQAEAAELRSPLQRAYIPVLRFATRFRAVTILIGIAVLIGTGLLLPGLKTNFLDSTGRDTTQVSMTMPAGTDLATTDRAAKKIERVLAETDEVASYQANIGAGNPMLGGIGAAADRATFSVTVDDEAETPDVEAKLRERIAELDGVGDVTVGIRGGNEEMGGNAVEVIVTGSDREALAEAAEQVEAVMTDIDGLRDVTSDLRDAAPRVQISVRKEKAAELGLSEATIGQYVAQAFRGSPVGEVTVDGRTVDLVLASAQRKPATIADIEKLEIPTAAGPVRLSDLAVVREVDGPTQISRLDGERAVTISAAADIDDLGAVTNEITVALRELGLPDGTDYQIGGTSAEQQEAFADLQLAMLIAIALVFIIMVATFRSFVQPLILLVSVPFAATGAIGLLRLTDTPLGVPAMIGLLMLIGIVVTNAIVLIDLINQYRAQGMSVRDAVIAGGRRRLRPILMTAVATICALIPMAIGLTGSGGFIAQSLAIVVIGGLLTSTLLTLVLVPTLYSLVEGGKERIRRGFRRRIAKPSAAE